MTKDWSVIAFSLRTPLTSLQIAPQPCIHLSAVWIPPPTPGQVALPTKPEAGRGKRAGGLCASGTLKVLASSVQFYLSWCHQ